MCSMHPLFLDDYSFIQLLICLRAAVRELLWSKSSDRSLLSNIERAARRWLFRVQRGRHRAFCEPFKFEFGIKEYECLRWCVPAFARRCEYNWQWPYWPRYSASVSSIGGLCDFATGKWGLFLLNVKAAVAAGALSINNSFLRTVQDAMPTITQPVQRHVNVLSDSLASECPQIEPILKSTQYWYVWFSVLYKTGEQPVIPPEHI